MIDAHTERMMKVIRKAEARDLAAVLELAALLWPGHSGEELAEEFGELISDPKAAVFLAFQAGQAVGFAQCQLRQDYVEGTDSSPVGYLEGIYVREVHRGRGLARELVRHCEDFARAQGCRQFASDCTLSNTQSLRFHLATGFREAGRIICFVKEL